MQTPHSKAFGRYLKTIRKQNGMTQTHMAMRLGMSVSWLCDIESGRHIGMDYDQCTQTRDILHLNQEEFEMLLNLAGAARGTIPIDLIDYVQERPNLINCLRVARATEMTDKAWDEMATCIVKQTLKGGNRNA